MIPWNSWAVKSARASNLDTCLQSCGPNCNAECIAKDLQRFREDYQHALIHEPPLVRPVNRRGDFVINAQGIVQGPLRYSEWLAYAYALLDNFHELLKDGESFKWADLYFRSEDDFYSGSYSHFSPISLLLARKLQSDQVAHRSYQVIHSGVDIYENIHPIHFRHKRKFRNHGQDHYQDCTNIKLGYFNSSLFETSSL